MLGAWPGLAHDALDLGADLAITTDYRDVLADVMEHHMNFAGTATFFRATRARVWAFSRTLAR